LMVLTLEKRLELSLFHWTPAWTVHLSATSDIKIWQLCITLTRSMLLKQRPKAHAIFYYWFSVRPNAVLNRVVACCREGSHSLLVHRKGFWRILARP
jgi:hypothetical protein